MKEIEIPFGANDSELKGWEYTIPEGMEAEIKDGKIVVREKESEGERIRKGLIEALKTSKTVGELKFILPEPTREECIAYLEKQKENPKSADSIPSDCVSDAKCEDRSPKHSDSDGTDIRDTPAYWKGWDDAMKQKEQKHPNGCFTCDEYKKGYESGRSNGFTAGYNKAMKEIDQKEQKPADRFEEARGKYQVEWSEEDKRIITRLIDYFESFRIVGVTTKWEGLDIQEVITLLKSLRPQPKQEWSEEDEKMRNLIVAIFEVNHSDSFFKANEIYTTDMRSVHTDEIIAWLQSLRPQYYGDVTMTEAYKMGLEAGKASSWKPSKEQMDALQSAINACESEWVYQDDELRSLLTDLKKLM